MRVLPLLLVSHSLPQQNQAKKHVQLSSAYQRATEKNHAAASPLKPERVYAAFVCFIAEQSCTCLMHGCLTIHRHVIGHYTKYSIILFKLLIAYCAHILVRGGVYRRLFGRVLNVCKSHIDHRSAWQMGCAAPLALICCLCLCTCRCPCYLCIAVLSVAFHHVGIRLNG